MSEYSNVLRLVYDGYCNHDDESYYRCPNCGAKYTGWGFFRRGIKNHDQFNCDFCGALLIYE